MSHLPPKKGYKVQVYKCILKWINHTHDEKSVNYHVFKMEGVNFLRGKKVTQEI